MAYASIAHRYPILSPSLVTAFLFGAGDVIAQQAVEKKGKSHDLVRTGRLALYGGVIFAPAVSQWYKVGFRLKISPKLSILPPKKLLDRLPIQNKPTLVASRVVLDQFAFAPVIVGVFFTATTLMQGKSLDDVKSKLQTDYKPTLVTNWYVFVPFQTLNMSLVPLQHRLLAVNVISLFWNTYLSLVVGRSSLPLKPVSA